MSEHILINRSHLQQAKQRYLAGDEQIASLVSHLQHEANACVAQGLYSVTHKTKLPPSGNPHDYATLGIYWWPDPNKKDGLPYVRRDGYLNPEALDDTCYDRNRLESFAHALSTVSLAYYYTDNPCYLSHTHQLLRTWFVDESTKMNPHLNYAQGIPGHCDGRDFGIIDTYRLLDVIEAAVLTGFPEMPALQRWADAYLTWLLTSENGKSESEKQNNHGMWYDAQVLLLADFCGKQGVIAPRLQQFTKARFDAQIAPDGSLPEELARTKSFDYTLFSLQAMIVCAEIGKRYGVDLWNYQTPTGGSLKRVFDFLLPHLKQQTWHWEQLGKTLFAHGAVKLSFVFQTFGEAVYAQTAKQVWANINPNDWPKQAMLRYPLFLL